MPGQSFTTTFLSDQTPDAIFQAITDVRGWWTGDVQIAGSAAKLGDEFTYTYRDVHYCKQKITELVPGEKITWHVLEANLSFTEDPAEWAGTDITFEVTPKDGQTEVRFTHLGLVPEFECFDRCSSAWGFYINGSLRHLIATGEGLAPPWA
jgi:uncharacterized protein YndB with AHSA1/START domain